MKHIQDGITYTILDDVLKSYNGVSPFRKPIWDGEMIVEGWTEEDDKLEIQRQLKVESEIQKEKLVKDILETNVIISAQTSDDTDSLDSQSLFPFWDGNGFTYPIDFKCQSFTKENELVLYKCVQSHTSESEWLPEIVPALFTRVAYPDEILEWKQPTGAQDAYKLGAIVTYNGKTWENTGSDANVWEPGVFGWTVID